MGIQRVLLTKVGIIKPDNSLSTEAIAIWDTGATGSVITKQIALKLGLIATGLSQVSTANGIALQNTYTVQIQLLNGITVSNVVVTEVDALSGGCDVLIGMDIITLGDFSITNHKGVTCMSFRIPSSHEIDYVKSPDFGMVKVSIGKERSWEKKFRK